MDNHLPNTPGSSVPSTPTQNSIDDYQPPAGLSMQTAPPVSPAPPSTPTPTASASQPSSGSEALEDQNIFHLLGIMEAADKEKEEFLDELQQVIWEDFLENDVELLLTAEELSEFKKISGKVMSDEAQHQAEMVEYLEKLIPDLEKIMLEKALELKEEMTRERVKELKEIFAQDQDKLAKVTEAQKLMDNQQWRAAADVLNTLPL